MATEDAVAKVVLDELVPEIEAYLRVVDAFRREGIEPTWAPERRRRRRMHAATSSAPVVTEGEV
jgi:hypothetical protein